MNSLVHRNNAQFRILGRLDERLQARQREIVRASDRKLRYADLLTPLGLQENAFLKACFLRRKFTEIEALQGSSFESDTD